MALNRTIASVFILLAAIACGEDKSHDYSYEFREVPFTDVKISENSFWGQRLHACRTTTIPLALGKCREYGRYDNFVKARLQMDADHNLGFEVGGFPFDDTDVYKTIEGVSYLLQTYPDPALESYVDSVLVLVAAAQEPDGYLNTARTMNPLKPHDWMGKERWSEVEVLSHEFYNLGHMVEAAVAHYKATGKTSFLDIARRYADCVCRNIGDGPGQIVRVPGHQIAEMALAKLYTVTGDEKYLNQARFFLEKRGSTSRKDAYSQAHLPVLQQDEAVGHAVRAEYMYSGIADVAALTGEKAYVEAIDRIWENIVGKKLYITGGVGSRYDGEAFGPAYELPNLTSYCETCAAIGNVYFNHRMFLLHGDAKYYDVLERTLYNGLISGMSLDGGAFFYPNPLESDGRFQRQSWFGCACCPSNLCRFIPSVPGYAYATKDRDIFVNLYMEGDADIALDRGSVKLCQQTDYPWSGDVKICIADNSAGRFTLKLRVPIWARGEVLPSDLYHFADTVSMCCSACVNGEPVPFPADEKGYLNIERRWKKGDIVTLHMDMPARLVEACDSVADDRGLLCVQRGPLVYCAEQADNSFDLNSAILANHPSLRTEELPEDSFFRQYGNMVALSASLEGEGNSLSLIPYYAWNHRGKGQMRVWFRH